MAATLNKVFLMGNLTRDPEMKQTPSGDIVAELGLAVTEQFRSRATNEVREVVTFVDVTVWGKVAENCGAYLTKGRPVFVEGRLVLDSWEDKTTGQKRTRLRVRADRVQFLYAPNRSDRRDLSGSTLGGEWSPENGSNRGIAQPEDYSQAANTNANDQFTPGASAPSVESRDAEDLPF
ncbi:MAG: single-stranded DNA-binding protein [bacterium]|nr:single-stranded DNA-binding protein [bacterium]